MANSRKFLMLQSILSTRGKSDLHVIPWLALLYLLNFLDRGSGNAKVGFSSFTNYLPPFADIQSACVSQLYNLEADIGINDLQYLIALTVFFFPYAILEVCSISPTQYLIKMFEACKQRPPSAVQTLQILVNHDVDVGNGDGMTNPNGFVALHNLPADLLRRD